MAISESSFSSRVRRLSFKLHRTQFQILENKSVKFIMAVIRKANRDDLSNLAAGISYYALLSLFPLMLALLAIFGLFLPSESVQKQLISLFSQYFPGSVNLLASSIQDIIRLRGALGIVGILGLLWTGSGVVNSITKAINKTWELSYNHPFYIKKPREIGMVMVIGILFLLSLGTSAFLTFIGQFNLPLSSVIINISTAVIACCFSLLVFMLVQKLTPIIWVSWRKIWPGAVLSTILFEVAKTLFVLYLNHFGNYDKIYGSISSIIVLLVWIYCSAFILLLGVEFNVMLFRLKRYGDNFADPDIENKFRNIYPLEPHN